MQHRAYATHKFSSNAEDIRDGFNPWVRTIPWSRKWQPAIVVFPGKFHGQRSLVDLQYMELQRVRHNCTHTQSSMSRILSILLLYLHIIYVDI